MFEEVVLFWGRRVDVFGFGDGSGVGFFILELEWFFVAFGVDDELEELDDFLIFAFVVEDHFEEFGELDFARLVFVD